MSSTKGSASLCKRLGRCVAVRRTDEALAEFWNADGDIDVSACNILLNLLCEEEDVKSIERVLEHMCSSGVSWDAPTVAIMTGFYSRKGDTLRAWKLLAAHEGGLKLKCYAPVMSALCESGDMDTAMQVFNHMVMNRIDLSDVEYIALFTAIREQGYSTDASQILLHLQRSNRACGEPLVHAIRTYFDGCPETSRGTATACHRGCSTLR